MTKAISAALKAHLASDVTTVATCWRLARADGMEYFFTDHDQDITFSGDIYEAASGMLPSSLAQSRGMAVDNIDLTAFLEANKFAETDLVAGLFDGATMDVFILNYQDLSQGVMYLAKGWTLGNVEIRDNAFTVEVRGLCQHLQQSFVDLYSPSCRADLGDAACGIDLNDPAFRQAGAVTSVSEDRRVFVDSSLITGSGSDDVFRYGTITWAAPGSGDVWPGLNAGLLMEVKVYDVITGEVELFHPMPYAINVGDEFELVYGCDKHADTCRARFANLVNFRGEPFIPSVDLTVTFFHPPSERASRRGSITPQ